MVSDVILSISVAFRKVGGLSDSEAGEENRQWELQAQNLVRRTSSVLNVSVGCKLAATGNESRNTDLGQIMEAF